MHRLSKLLLPKTRGLTVCPTNSRTNLVVNYQDVVGSYIYNIGEWEPDVAWALRKFLKRGDVFLDAGAYIGDMSCLAAKYVGDSGVVYAFEPSIDNYGMLCQNIRLNSLFNVHTFRMALGSSNTTGTMRIKSASNRGSDMLDLKVRAQEEQVHVTTIDTLIDTGQIEKPDFVKIDVEGHEYEVLKGCNELLKASSPILCIETWEQNTFKIYAFITSFGTYSVYTIEYGLPFRLGHKPLNKLGERANLICLPVM